MPAATPEGAEAARRLGEARALYEVGVAALERGDARASEALRQGASIAPIEPSLYLRLARACRDHGATARAVDFYRKYLAEGPAAAEAAAVQAELTTVSEALDDPFSPPGAPNELPLRALGFGALALGVATVAVARHQRRRIRLAALLGRHPERAASFAYFAGTLRHELLKHRIAPLRSQGPSGRVAPAEPLERAWRRHVDALGAALGLRPDWIRREPMFRAADRAVARLGEEERGGEELAPDRDALETLAALDRALVGWCRLARRTLIDGDLFERLVRSLRDERVGGRLGVEVEVVLHEQALVASIFHDDLLLVLRNLARNAISVTAELEVKAIRIESGVLIDETGAEWVRIAIHDASVRRPERGVRASDRGLGIVTDTLERYGGALVEVPPAAGFLKAFAISLPRAEDDLGGAAAQALVAA